MSGFLIQAIVLLAAAVIAVPFSQRLGLGTVLGYLFAGIVVGQISGLLGTPDTGLVGVAEFGVVMLLFVIGLEMEPETLWDLRHKLIGLGGLQIVVTTFIIAAAGRDAWPAMGNEHRDRDGTRTFFHRNGDPDAFREGAHPNQWWTIRRLGLV